ncbi:MAG: MATE family efflux transporter [Spirochaetaceae bacterium]
MIAKLRQTANRDFFNRIFSIAIPVTLQNLLSSSRNLIDTIMIGALGVTQIAAVGAAGKPFFVLFIMLLGLTNGSGILISQFWGKKDADGVARNVLLSAMISLSISIILSVLIKIFANQIIAISSNDPEVIRYGSEYLKIISNNLMLQSIILSFNIGLSSTGQVKKCTLVSFIGVISNVFLNYTLIFGHFGFKAMGLKGAAYGTLFSCLLEATLIVIITLFFNSAFRLSITKFKQQMTPQGIKKLLSLSLPLSFAALAWASGTYVYYIIYGRIGSNELAIMTMIEPVSSIMIAFYRGLATGTSIILGHSLGEEKYEKVWQEAKVLLFMGFLLSISIFILMLICKPIYLGFFTAMPAETIVMTGIIFTILLVKMLFMAVNIIIIVGILRSGGDTKFVMKLDVSCQWFLGIPLGFLAAFVWKLSLAWVFIFIITEEVFKIFVAMKRMRSKKWIRNLIK